MKATFRTLLSLAIVLGVVVMAVRAEDKEGEKVTLKGELGCPKCVFMVKGVKACGNAIKVTKDGKDTIYIFQDKGGKESYHGKICSEGAKGSVTGTLVKKGKQFLIKPDADGVKFD